VGKWFGKLMTGVGLTDPALVLHSFRHTGITRFHEVGIPESHARFLTGHSGGGDVHNSTYTHRDAFPLAVLRASLERLAYPAVVAALAAKGSVHPGVSER
jgi:integrase